MNRQTTLNLPGQTGLILGRESELAEIPALLADAQCHLLTLVGPGGIGKTRLAVEVAAHLDGFADGIYFVPLQPVASADQLIPAIATLTGLPLAGTEPLLTQLIHNLRTKQMLLILDNFEHLLPAADLIIELLRAAPKVKFLVTSREALQLREEWLYPVQGLSIPAAGATDDPARYGAIQLFLARARQVRRDFRWENERDAVVAICRHVEGSPLAVELAVSWLATLDSAAIAEQLRQSVDILTSPLRDHPERHRSMRVVFDHSWQLLSDSERAVFTRLTVFRGGFTLPAAQAVAGASLADLSALVAKSLIRRDAGGRYHIHELLRQYGGEKLAASPQAVVDAHTAHADYFLSYLNERREVLEGPEQIRAAREIATEHENIYGAWRWAVAHIDTEAQAEAMRLGVAALMRYHQLSSRYLEGAAILAYTIQTLESDTRAEAHIPILAECLIYDGQLAIRLGRPKQAEQSLERVRHLYERIPGLSRYGFMNLKKGSMILALVQGEYDRAIGLAHEARLLAQEQKEIPSLSLAHYGLASAALAQGDYEQARREAEQTLTLAESVGQRWLSIISHDILGQVASAQGELRTAKRHFEIAYALSEEFSAAGATALHLKNLGDVALLQQQWAEARGFYAQSLDRYQFVGDRGGSVAAERGLGIAAFHLGDLNGARRHFLKALEMAVATDTIRIVLAVFAAAGQFLVEHGGGSRSRTLGLQLLRFAGQHPACDRTTHNESASYLERKGLLRGASSSTLLGGTLLGDLPGDAALDVLIAALQAELTVAPEPVLPPAQTNGAGPVEPLTERELEVLKLLGAGRSNKEIARELIVAVGTVKAHTSSIYRKLDAANRGQAILRAHALGLLD